jgi:hypothetical protein
LRLNSDFLACGFIRTLALSTLYFPVFATFVTSSHRTALATGPLLELCHDANGTPDCSEEDSHL